MGTPTTEGEYEQAVETTQYLTSRTDVQPVIGLICGSGLGNLADKLEDALSIPYEEIPHFPHCTAPGHSGKLVFGRLGGKQIVCMQGRFHLYEGHDVRKTTFPVRVMKLLGVKLLMTTCAAGSVNPDYNIGDMAIIQDHINLPALVGLGPLYGPNDSRFGPRFPSMSAVYSQDLIDTGRQVAKELGYDWVHTGISLTQTGPSYETVAEARMFRLLGADLCGMSTSPEVTVAAHMGMKVFAVATITNRCVTEYNVIEGHPDCDEVVAVSKSRTPQLSSFICGVIKECQI